MTFITRQTRLTFGGLPTRCTEGRHWGGMQEVLNAKNRRLHFLRSAVLFAALAAEAFANELLADLLPRRDWRRSTTCRRPRSC